MHTFIGIFHTDTPTHIPGLFPIAGSLPLAISCALFSSLALAGLISVALRLEDPFDGDSPDDIRVDEDLEDLQHALHKKPSVVGQKLESMSIYALPRHKLHH